jgi:hypothetical protein
VEFDHDLADWCRKWVGQVGWEADHDGALRWGDETPLTREPRALLRLVALCPGDLRPRLVAALGEASRHDPDRVGRYTQLLFWIQSVAHGWTALPEVSEEVMRLLLADHFDVQPTEAAWYFAARRGCGLRLPVRNHRLVFAACPHCGGGYDPRQSEWSSTKWLDK